MRSKCRHHLVTVAERTQQTSLLRLRPLTPKWVNACAARRCYASAASADIHTPENRSRGLSVPSRARHNELGVQQVSSHIHEQLFPSPTTSKPTADLIALSQRHLARHDLLGKTTDHADPIAFDLPSLQGASLDEHFFRLGKQSSEPYLTFAKKYARASPPDRPRKWVERSGWTKYYDDGSSEAVPFPDANVLTFDTEVMWMESNYPVMACAVSANHWYAWLSPWLLGESDSDKHLIPLGDAQTERIVVGHNIGYDRARIREEYDLRQSRNFFVDTMSLHVAVNGMCSQQRPTWMKHRKAKEIQDQIAASDDAADLSALLDSKGNLEEEADLWVGRSSVNSLRDVAKFHCGITIDKARREWFGELDRKGVLERVDELLDYCAADVEITHKVYKKVFPLFLEKCPHPVSFAALRHLSAEILPVDRSWDAYIANAEATYQKLSAGVEERLVDLAEKALEHRASPDVYERDPWLCQLDWAGQQVRMTKPKKKGEEPRPAARQKKPGMPNWYRDLFANNDSDIALTVRTRIAPLLLRLAWDGHPLVWSDKFGWTFRVPYDQATKYQEQGLTACDMLEEENAQLRDDLEHAFFKLPHRDGPTARCVSPLAKGYLVFFENGTLASEYEYAREALDMNASCSYWISARDRIRSQMVVYEDERLDSPDPSRAGTQQGYILPQVIPMGTITRRAVENTWLTASNAKTNRVGSELKSIITAPPGYCFVGADVDSQELWIASLVGDAAFKLHGGNAIGFMTLEGTKAAGTDLHSRTAQILGISRNDAKVFNYGRIYGAGLKFAQSLLRRFNPTLKEEEANVIADRLYLSTKGKKERRKVLSERSFWRGGTESLVFNKLEEFADQERPRTPVLGAGITEALMRRFISKGSFMTSRINWAIQSSGVDYLHLLIVSMEYLCLRYNIAARLALTVHDEIRYLAPEEDKYRCALALQIANVWTRAMFSQQMGIDDLPQSCAYFSAVDIDSVLRKEVDMDCVTPSHPAKIPPGESLDIAQLLAKGEEAMLGEPTRSASVHGSDAAEVEYVRRKPVMEDLASGEQMHYLRAQIAEDATELNRIVKEIKPAPSLSLSASSASGLGDDTPKKRGRKPKSSSPSSATASSAQRLYTRHPAAHLPSFEFAREEMRKKDGGGVLEDGNAFKEAMRGWGNTAVDVGLMKRFEDGVVVERR